MLGTFELLTLINTQAEVSYVHTHTLLTHSYTLSA